MLSWARRLLDDLRDRSARRKRASERYDLIKTILPALAGIAAYPEQAQKIGAQLFAIPGAAIPVIGLTVAIVVTAAVVTGKTSVISPDITLLSSDERLTVEYLYTQPLRHTAKLTLLAAFFVLPHAIYKLILEESPLPVKIYGRVISATDGKAIKDARIRIVTEEGSDLTDGEWLTDTGGFFIVRSLQRAKRTAALVIAIPTCTQTVKVPLLHSFEEPSQQNRSISPFFKIIVSCPTGGVR